MEVKSLIQNEKKFNGFIDDNELELFWPTISIAGITSSVIALIERRMCGRHLERAHAEEVTIKNKVFLE